MRYHRDLAKPSDDAALRRPMASTPMPDAVTLSFHREPNSFSSDRVQEPKRQTLIIRDQESSDIVVVATRAAQDMYVAGVKQLVRYLGGLRIANCARGHGLLARGFRFLRELHDADETRPAYYLTTIAEGNARAIELRTSGRAGLPTYHLLCRLHTFVLPIGGMIGRPVPASGCHVEPLVDWGGSNTFRSMGPSSILIARKDGRMVGGAGLWDQRSFRQTVVRQYSRSIAAAKIVTDRTPTTQMMLVGFCEGDPLLPVAKQFARSTYTTRLYAVSWDPLPSCVTDRAAHRYYLELGCL